MPEHDEDNQNLTGIRDEDYYMDFVTFKVSTPPFAFQRRFDTGSAGTECAVQSTEGRLR